MIEPKISTFLVDPLGETSRKERRNLLAASVVGLLISKVGLIPTKISALGIELSGSSQIAFTILAAGIILYFVLAFLLYGLSDFLIWRERYQQYLEDVRSYNEGWSEEDQQQYDTKVTDLGSVAWIYRLAKPTALFRCIFEFALPLTFGIYVLYTLAANAWLP